MQPYPIAIEQTQLDDLQRRLESARWPAELPGAGWDYGANLAYMISIALLAILLAAVFLFSDTMSWHLKI